MNAKKQILIVEDDDELRRMLARMLGQDYVVHEATDGLDALEVLAALPAPPDLIVLDVMMPRLDGVTVAKHLKALEPYKQVPIVMLTAKDDVMAVIDGINAGARHYLTKPFSHVDLRDRIRRLMTK